MASTGIHHFQVEHNSSSHDQKFSIFDEDENCLYTIKSPAVSLRGKFTFLDDDNNKELFKIRRRMKHIHTTFEIYNAQDNDEDDENVLATIKKVGNPLTPRFQIQSIHGEYEIKRNENSIDGEYSLIRNGHIIAEVKRKRFPVLSERYTVTIDEHVSYRHIPFILSLIITLWCAQ